MRSVISQSKSVILQGIIVGHLKPVLLKDLSRRNPTWLQQNLLLRLFKLFEELSLYWFHLSFFFLQLLVFNFILLFYPWEFYFNISCIGTIHHFNSTQKTKLWQLKVKNKAGYTLHIFCMGLRVLGSFLSLLTLVVKISAR